MIWLRGIYYIRFSPERSVDYSAIGHESQALGLNLHLHTLWA